MAYKRKINRKPFDPAFYPYNGYKHLRRTSLQDPERIERLRWRQLLRYHEVWTPRWIDVCARIEHLREAFVGCPKRSIRLIYESHGISEDSDYWEMKEESPLRSLAKAASVTDEKLKAGSDYMRARAASYAHHTRVRRLNDLLERSVQELQFLPAGQAYDRRRVTVRLNGRDYAFELGYKPKALTDQWPAPGHMICEVPQFKIDESLIGLYRELVRTRFGEPPLTFSSRKADRWENIWVYGAVGVRFSRQDVVDKILGPKAVSKILKTAR